MTEAIRVLLLVIGALAAGITSLNAFLLAYPGDLVSQTILIVLGGVDAFLSATMVYVLASLAKTNGVP